MATATSVPLREKSQEAFITYFKSILDMQNTFNPERRSKLEYLDRVYQRELDRTKEHMRAKAANRRGDSSRFQNMTVPVVAPQVEAAVVYQTSVFLTGYPIFGVVASPQFIDEAMQMESLLEDQATVGGWTRQLIMFFRDGFKYNFAPLEVSWEREVTSNVTTDLTDTIREGKVETALWSGNKIKRLDPYNTFVDPRVPPTEVYKTGEFAGYSERISKIALKKLIAELPDKIIANIRPALESSLAGSGGNSSSASLFTPDVNPDVSMSLRNYGEEDWLSWARLPDSGDTAIKYKDSYEISYLYCRVLPSEFSMEVPSKNTPQIFKLIIINQQHIIYAEKQTNAHNYLPILIGQPHEDGLAYQTKSLAENGVPFQDLASAYMNSIIHSRRRAINDRVLFDPSRITAAHINSDNASAKIPVRPAAYGKNIADAVYQFPYREDQTAGSMQQIQTILSLANQLSGQNQASQGQFVKGNKTLQEFQSVMDNANGRDQMAAILLESQVFTPLKRILKLNILQYQGGTTIYNREKEVAVEIDPVALRKAVIDFKVTDGLTPASKLLNTDAFTVALQVLGSSPSIAAGYNVPSLFSYLLKSQGAKISSFEKSQEQLAFEQAMGSWQQVAMLAVEKGTDLKDLPPAPKPEDFGYTPSDNKQAPAEATQQQGNEQTTQVGL